MNNSSFDKYVKSLTDGQRLELLRSLCKTDTKQPILTFGEGIKRVFHHGHLEAADCLAKSLEHLLETDGPKELGADMAKLLSCVIEDALPA
jgi:hypothetical protein